MARAVAAEAVAEATAASKSAAVAPVARAVVVEEAAVRVARVNLEWAAAPASASTSGTPRRPLYAFRSPQPTVAQADAEATGRLAAQAAVEDLAAARPLVHARSADRVLRVDVEAMAVQAALVAAEAAARADPASAS